MNIFLYINRVLMNNYYLIKVSKKRVLVTFQFYHDALATLAPIVDRYGEHEYIVLTRERAEKLFPNIKEEPALKMKGGI